MNVYHYMLIAVFALFLLVFTCTACVICAKKPLTAGTEKRQRKLFIHSLSEDWGKVK